jgi:hypothetical protein
VEGVLEVGPYTGRNRLLKHGPLRISENGRYLEHRDGTPFFWLGDTWWSLMSDRVRWPEGFKALVDNRAKKGFSLVQTVVGFEPETEFNDERNANEGGQPWFSGDEMYTGINPAYFDAADKRIQWLIRRGIVPCIVGSWGYHLRWLGVEKVKAHWRYLVARHGCYPVVWCVAGEVMMPYEMYFIENHAQASPQARADWSDVARYLRAVDPYSHPVTLHPFGGTASWDNAESDDLLDFQMLQPGHGPNGHGIETGIELIAEGRARVPAKPVVNGEPPYEGHLQANYQSTQRMAFWTGFLLGQAGHTYGAPGIFPANDRERPMGNRPGGGAYDSMTWDEAMHLPGSAQLGLGKELLCRYEWWRFEPHPEWAELSIDICPHWYRPAIRAYPAGIPRTVRVVYLPCRFYQWEGPLVRHIEPDVTYRAFYFDPISARERDLGTVVPEPDGSWQAPMMPVCQDWVLVMEALPA